MIREIRWHQVIIAFLLGCVVSASIVHYSWMHPTDPATRYQHMLNRFSHKLHLSDDQRTKVDVIFKTQHEKIMSLRAEVGPRFEEVHRSASQEIRQLLTPEQQTKFDEMEKRHAEMRKRWGEHEFGPLPPK